MGNPAQMKGYIIKDNQILDLQLPTRMATCMTILK